MVRQRDEAWRDGEGGGPSSLGVINKACLVRPGARREPREVSGCGEKHPLLYQLGVSLPLPPSIPAWGSPILSARA